MSIWVKWGISLVAGVGVIALGWRFPWLLITFHVVICFLLIIVVLLQSGKAADLAGAFGGAGSQTAFGPRGAATLLSKATTWCFIMFLLTSMAQVLRQTQVGPQQGSSVIERTQQPAPAPEQPAPTPTPATPAPQQQPTPPPPQ